MSKISFFIIKDPDHQTSILFASLFVVCNLFIEFRLLFEELSIFTVLFALIKTFFSSFPFLSWLPFFNCKYGPFGTFVSLLPKIRHCSILLFISLITYSFRVDFLFGRFLSFFKNLLFCFSNIMSHSYKFLSKDARFLSIDELTLFGLLESRAFGPVKKHYEASSDVLTVPGFSTTHGMQSASY
jgi:hypothetical protein